MNEIQNLNPQCIWKNFYALTQVPRPSGHLEKVQKFLLDFAKEIGVEAFIDSGQNVVMRKPATPGMGNRKGVILQAHMDMVPQKTPESKHNFEADPIEPWIDGDWVKAKNTTLGADNGIGVAAIMAVLEAKDIKHGPIEALITADEE
ncbi:MAG: M20/M25/M40 family metallo-hydrolase, partial [Prevotella sp.]|nr:M20/M25/M40 family metallo-hydrolase [Prevotella sp.]